MYWYSPSIPASDSLRASMASSIAFVDSFVLSTSSCSSSEKLRIASILSSVESSNKSIAPTSPAIRPITPTIGSAAMLTDKAVDATRAAVKPAVNVLIDINNLTIAPIIAVIRDTANAIIIAEPKVLI